MPLFAEIIAMRCVFSILLLICVNSVIWGQTPKDSPASKKTPLTEAQERLQRGNLAEAQAGFEKLLDDPVHQAAAAIGLAQRYSLTGDYDKATQVLDEMLKKKADHPDLLAHRADLRFSLGKWEEAKKDAEAAIKLKEDQFLARWVRARILRDSGDLKAADTEMRWFVRTYSQRDEDDKPITDPAELVLVGLAGAENARRNVLPQQFRFIINEIAPDALKANPNYWQAEVMVGDILLEKYNRPQALEAYENALKINPKVAVAYVGQGRIFFQQYEMKEAEANADKALEINPNLVSALRLKAEVRLAGGDLAEARKLLEKAKSINPREEAVYGKLAATEYLSRNKQAVKTLAAEVEQFNTKPGVFYYELALALEDRRLYGDSEIFLKKAIELRDDLAGPKAALGMLYLRLGNEEEGRKYLDLAFKLDSFHVRVSNSRKVLDHLAKYETLQTKNYTIKFDPKNDTLLAQFLADYLEEVHAKLAKDFAFEPSGRTLVEIFNNHEMFSGRTVGLPDLHTIGACTGRVVTMVSPKGKGIRAPFNWGRVIRHELVHVFNLAQTDFQCPHWLTEGLAVRQEGGNRPPIWNVILRERFEKNDLLNLDTILLGFVRPRNQAEWNLAYCQANLYVQFVIDTFGIEAIAKLLNAYREGLDDATALSKTLDLSKEEFEKRYRNYIEKQVKAISTRPQTAPEKPMKFDELLKAHQANPDDVDLAARVADGYERRRMLNEARKLVDEVLNKSEGHPLATLVKARLLLNAGDNVGAVALLEIALKKDETHPKLLEEIGRIYKKEGNLEKAARYFEKGRKVAPVDGNWLRELIDIYLKEKDSPRLIDVLSEQVANDADDLKSRLQLANLLLEAKEFAKAEAIAWDALLIDVTNPEAQQAMLSALEGQNKVELLEKFKTRFQK